MKLSKTRIQKLLSGVEVKSFGAVSSTNGLARSEGANTLIIASCQTSGRGRSGKSFRSYRGGLYFTLVLPYDNAALLTVRAAAALASAIEEESGVRCGIKWINDLYLGDKKAAGILAESFMRGEERLIALGMGLNYSKDGFPKDISGFACPLGLKTKRTAEKIVAKTVQTLLLGGFNRDYYLSRSTTIGRAVTFTENGETLTGTACGITEEGYLIVEGNHIISSAESIVK
ncbi:MAG: biotin--[acetyl-CoA-carboxylase] ligase [Christensenellales bacterium]